jgi:hypothetical protein
VTHSSSASDLDDALTTLDDELDSPVARRPTPTILTHAVVRREAPRADEDTLERELSSLERQLTSYEHAAGGWVFRGPLGPTSVQS